MPGVRIPGPKPPPPAPSLTAWNISPRPVPGISFRKETSPATLQVSPMDRSTSLAWTPAPTLRSAHEPTLPAPAGANTYSPWSTRRSFTVLSTVAVSTWFQTTDDQFKLDTQNGTETFGASSVRVATSVKQAIIGYGEGTVQTPEYQTWDGTAW